MKYLPFTSVFVPILIIGMTLVSGCLIGDGERDYAMSHITPTPQIIHETVQITPNPIITTPTANTSDSTPLTMVVKGNGYYNSVDIVELSGFGPKGKSVSISWTDSSHTQHWIFNVAKIHDDGRWSFDLDLHKFQVARDQITVTAVIYGEKSAPVIITIV
ncbi:MAG: hypothetical protein WC379_15295 [Methanoregula sp.]